MPRIADPSSLARLDADRVGDLRRRQTRVQTESLLARAQWLCRSERELIGSIYEQGRRVSDVAAMMDVDPRWLRSKVRRIVQRVSTPEFAFVALHLHDWPPSTQKVARACVLEGRSQRDAARTLKMSLHTVRKHRDAIVRMAQLGGAR